ncbi:MAG: helix-turn-helix transcriptional regulator [Planctomycetota bacterium]
MARPSTLEPPPIDLGTETIGERIARVRKDRGFTQTELATEMGIIQKLVSDYERDRLRPHPEMLARFALAMEVSTDELIGLKKIKTSKTISNRRLLRRLAQIEALPKKAQDTIIGMIDLAIANTGR